MLVLGATLVAGGAHAGGYFLNFSGTPSVMGCTDHSYVVGTGISYSWNLPSNNPAVHVTITAGTATVTDISDSLSGPSGTVNLPLLVANPFPTQTPPYPVTYTITPLIPGASSSSFSFVCGGAAGSNFTITNGASFGYTIPTLDPFWLIALVGLLWLVALRALRRASAAG